METYKKNVYRHYISGYDLRNEINLKKARRKERKIIRLLPNACEVEETDTKASEQKLLTRAKNVMVTLKKLGRFYYM